jgi:hypothetical protein
MSDPVAATARAEALSLWPGITARWQGPWLPPIRQAVPTGESTRLRSDRPADAVGQARWPKSPVVPPGLRVRTLHVHTTQTLDITLHFEVDGTLLADFEVAAEALPVLTPSDFGDIDG